MGIGDRDYMKRYPSWLPSTPWWRRIKLIPAIATASALLALGSAAIWFIGDVRDVLPDTDLAEGSLRVNINTATQEELESIPGIGEARANQIIARRPYKSVEQLLDISGIGPRSLESLKPFVKVEGETEKLP
jgi:competence ComEA-like helix-hairpin-helix protein